MTKNRLSWSKKLIESLLQTVLYALILGSSFLRWLNWRTFREDRSKIPSPGLIINFPIWVLLNPDHLDNLFTTLSHSEQRA